ncbi:MAG: hypothetical protein LC802_17165 [Acidobacteria bacterium]|nr:hypothetical protein [Acidobacteriota bacterium]
MKWSKLKKEVESRFAASVQGKVHLYSTRYRRPDSTLGRGWITYNKQQVVNFESFLSRINFGAYYHEATNTDCLTHAAVAEEERTPGLVLERGEFSRFDLHVACWEMLNLSIGEALTSKNPLIQGLAFLDRRVGKERVCSFPIEGLHPLAKKMLEIRRAEETAQLNGSLKPTVQ